MTARYPVQIGGATPVAAQELARARWVCLDSRTLFSPMLRGTGKCFTEVYRRAAALRPEWRFVMFHRAGPVSYVFADVANVQPRAVEIKGDRWALWQKVRLPLAARAAGADVLHCPANTGPAHPLVPMLLTVHDLIPMEPGFATPSSRRWGRRVAKAARKAKIITTPSEHTKRQLVKTFSLDAGKIRVIPWAANPACKPVEDRAELARVRAAHGLSADRPYAIAFGGQDPRKNTRRLVQAWARLPAGGEDRPQLLVVGMQEPMLGELQREVRAGGLGETCVLCGYVPEADLLALLSGAEIVCYPTLSEGFGLPVLDAFACGTAVLTSRVTSVPEVAGDAAVYVDPHSADDIARGVADLMGDEAARLELARVGRERARQFTWDRCAEAYCAALAECAERQ